MTIRGLRSIFIPIGFVVSVAAAGCGGPYDASLGGVVTLDGTVVPRGTVAFHPATGGPPAYALIREDGSYTVRTGREEGLPAGQYAVTVTANEPASVTQTATGGPPPPGKPITPAWYSTKNTSGLSFDVKPGKNEYNLELKSQPPPGWNPRGQR